MSYQPPPHGFRTFSILWATQSASVFGSALTFFAITIWLTQVRYPRPEQQPQLALALSAVALAFALPAVLGAPLAGAWADRHDRKRTMLAMDFANGCLGLILAALLAIGTLRVWLLLVLMAGFALLGAFHTAAFDTSYAMLVPERQLPRANGMMQTIFGLSGILSPAIAAGIIALPALARQGRAPAALGRLGDGAALAIALDAATFFLAAAVLLALRIPSPPRADLDADGGQPAPGIWADVREGARYIWRRRPLLWLLACFAAANFLSTPIGVFQPLLVKFTLAADWSARGFTFETALALLGAAFGAGGVAGGVLVSAWGGRRRRRVYGVLVPLLAGGVVQVVYGLSPLLYLTAAAAFLLGMEGPLANAHSQAIWQTQTPRELQGRVFAVRRLIAQFTFPLSTALAGWAAGLFDPGLIMAALGALLALFCLAQLFNPSLLRVEDKEWLDGLALASAERGMTKVE